MNEQRQQGFLDFVYNVNKLNTVFALSSVALVISTIWMVWDDYDREWKGLQREAMAMEQYKVEADLQAAQREIDQGELKKIEAEIAEVEASIQTQKERYEAALEVLEDLRGAFYKADQDGKFEKAGYDVIKYEYEEAAHHGHEKEAARKKAVMARMDSMIGVFRLVREGVEAKQAAQQKIVDEVAGRKKALEQQKSALFQKAELLQRNLINLVPSFPNVFRNLPMVDFIDPSVEVRQIVLGDLRNDINFTQVPKVDRCTTCHANIDREGYETDPETGFFRDEVLRKYIEEVYPEEERPARTKVFATHPRMDLYLSSASAHPVDQVGCTTCHLGRDRGITFNNTAHTPTDAAEAERWKKQYGWKKMKYWDYPMFSSQYGEASCAQCHTGGVEVKHANRLNRGMHLIRTVGCFGCHKIAIPGFQDLRKVGPDLRKIAGKVERRWALNWVRDPKGFRPATKMPKIFDLPNVDSPEDRTRNTAAINAIVTYLFETSERPIYPDPPVKGDGVRGEALVAKVGCRGCHVVGKDDDVGQEYGLRNFGPNINDVGSKLSAGWLFAWLKAPEAYFSETLMPNLRLTDQEAADITAYLLTLRNPDFENRRPAEVDRAVRDQLVLSYLQGRLPVAQARERLDAMSGLQRDLWLGEKIIARQGCFGCHHISGFEDTTPVGTELTEEGSKDVDKLDFGLLALKLGKSTHTLYESEKIPYTRHDWLFTKLKKPRVFDEGKVKTFDEKLRMPFFGFSDEDAHAVTTALLSFSKSFIFPTAKKQPTPEEIEIEKGRWLVYKRNCKGCHVIEGEGRAIEDVLVKAYAEEGVLEAEAVGFTPPVLNGEGKKVQPDWFFSFLKAPVPIRPWLEVRMPTFGFEDQDAIDIVTYFSRLDKQQFPYHTFAEKRLSPREMQGADALFSVEVYNCFTCHQQGDIKPKGDPASWAPDLAMARQRLMPEWIRDWLWDPQKIQPGTKMPTFFGDEMTYLPEEAGGMELARYLTLPEGVEPEGGGIELPTRYVIEVLTDYIIYGLHQEKRLSRR